MLAKNLVHRSIRALANAGVCGRQVKGIVDSTILETTERDTGFGWQRQRRRLLAQIRDHVIVFARDRYGIFHLAEYSLLLGSRLKDMPPGIGTPQEILVKYRLVALG